MKQNKASMNILAYFVVFALMAVSVSAYANPAIVNLGEAGNFAILSKVSISSVPTSIITGDIGVSPSSGTAITGITCPEVTGTIHVAAAGGDTLACQTVDPGYLTPTILEMEAAYTDSLSRAPDVIMGTDLGGLTLTPGVYTTATDLGITSDVFLDCGGNVNGVFIFQIAGKLDLAASSDVVLSGNCQSGNIFWAVAGTTTINGGSGTESTFEGTVLGGPATSEIAVVTGSTVNGRLLGQKGIAFDQNTVIKPTVIIDAMASDITLNTANDTWTANNQSSLDFTIVDDYSANASCSLFMNDTLYGTNASVANATSTLIAPDTQLAEGAYSWYIGCTDLGGNSGNSTSRLITIDMTAPNITSYTLSATSVDIGAAIVGTCVVTDNLDTTIVGNSTGIDTASAGTRNATCTATDLAGNVATASAEYTVNSPPSSGSSGGGGGGSSSRNSQPTVVSTPVDDVPDMPITYLSNNGNFAPISTDDSSAQDSGLADIAEPTIEASENQITGQVIGTSGQKPSLWLIALVLLVIGGLVAGGYFYFRD